MINKIGKIKFIKKEIISKIEVEGLFHEIKERNLFFLIDKIIEENISRI